MAIGKTVGKLSIRVIPDASKFRNDLKLLIERVEKSMVANLTVRADTRDAMLQISTLRTEAERNGIRMGVQLNDTVAAARVAALARTRNVVINAVVNEASFTKVINGSKGIVRALSGWSLVQQTIEDFKGRLMALPTAVPSIAKVSLAIGNLGGAAIAGIGGSATVLADLGRIITGFLPAAPGVLLGMGIGLTALVVAAKGGGKYLGGLKKPFQDLAEIIQTTFWDKAAGPINELVTTLMPQLQRGFQNVSAALGEQAAAVAGAVQTALGGGVLEGWFSTVAESMRIITPYVDDFVQAFVTLGTVGLGFMPAFAKWVGEIGRDFNTWVQASAKSGAFTGFVMGAIDALKGLWGVASAVVSIVGSIDKAATAAGGQGLNGMAVILGRIADALASGPVQAGMATLFAGAGMGVASLADGIANLLGSLGGMAPELATVLDLAGKTLGQFATDVGKALNQPAVKKGLVDLFAGLSSGLGAVGQVLPAVGEVIGHLLTALGTAMSTFGPLLAAVKETFAPKLVILADAANDLIPILGGALTGAVKALEGPLSVVFGVIGSNMGLFETLVVVVGGAALAFIAIQKAIAIYQGALVLVKGIQTGVMLGQYGLVGATYAVGAAQKVGAAAAVAAGLAQDLVTGALWNQIKANAQAAAAWVANKAKVVAASVAQAAAVVGNLAKEAAAWAAMKVKALAASAAVAAGVVKDLAKQGAAFLVQKASLVAAAAQWALLKGAQVAGAVATGVATAAQWLLNAAMSANPIALVVIAIAALVAGLIWFFTQTKLGQEIWANFTKFLGEAWTNLSAVASTVFGAIGTFISGVWNGIVTVAQTVWNALTSFIGTWGGVILAVLVPFLGVPLLIAQHWNEIVTTVRAVWDAVVAWVSGAIDNVAKVIVTVSLAIAKAWSEFWDGVFGFLRDTWNAITKWVSDAIATVKSVIDLVLKGMGVVWNAYWSGVFTFLKGIWDGIKGWVTDAIGNVKSTIDRVVGLIVTLWNAYWTALFSFYKGIWDGITGFIGGAVEKVRSAIDTGINAAKRVWNTVWGAIEDAVGNAWTGISGFVGKIVGGIKTLIGDVKDTLGDLPGTVKSAFTNAGTWLLSAGKAIIQGLIDGITAMIGAAKNAASGVMDAIARFFPHSPAKEGPFSGKGWTPYSGRAMGLGLVDGMDSTLGTVKKGALRLMSAAAQGTASIGVDSGITPSAAVLNGSGGGITIQGNVGWQPEELLREKELRERQQAMAFGIDSLAAFA